MYQSNNYSIDVVQYLLLGILTKIISHKSRLFYIRSHCLFTKQKVQNGKNNKSILE